MAPPTAQQSSNFWALFWTAPAGSLEQYLALVWETLHPRNRVQKGWWIALHKVWLFPATHCPNRLYILGHSQLISCYTPLMEHRLHCGPKAATANQSATARCHRN